MTATSVLARLLACLALVSATWNPTGVSYADWIGGGEPLALQVSATAVLLALHILFLRITWLSLGPAGLGFVVAALMAGVFTLSELGAIDLGRRQTWGYVFIIVTSLVLMTGVVWALMLRRVTGQARYLNPPP